MSKISKFMSLVLRHSPEKAGLTPNEKGFVGIANLVMAVQQHVDKDFSVKKLEELVASNDKKRFEFDTTGTRIRACQGHSIKVDLNLEPTEPPPMLYHGTIPENLHSIFETGLNKGTRHAVHLSEDKKTAEAVGARRGKAVILTILARQMHRDGHTFYRSTNGVWLTEAVPSEFIRKSPEFKES